MLRVAVCLSGHMRSYRRASASIFERIARPGEHDGVLAEYYIHTWAGVGASAGSWDASSDEELDLAEVSALYRPTGLCVERHNPESWPARSMFRKIKLAHRLAIESNREYDLYVRARPDSFFLEGERITTPRPGVVYLPDRAGFGGSCDQFACGDRAAMDHYSSLIDAQARDDHFHPEMRLKAHMSSVETETIQVRFKIMRSDGSLYDIMSLG